MASFRVLVRRSGSPTEGYGQIYGAVDGGGSCQEES